MFKSLKLYLRQQINPHLLTQELSAFGYQRQDEVLEEGDFSLRGETLDVFPASFDCPLRIGFDLDKISSLSSIDIQANRIVARHELVIILPKHKSYRRPAAGFKEELPLSLFVEFKKGDYLVHIQHGIGRYLGRQKMTSVSGQAEDAFVLEYADKEKLYVPCRDGHLIQKFIGLKGKLQPKLNRLGTREWQATKKRVRQAVLMVAVGMLKMQAARLSSQGFVFSRDSQWQEEFEKTFAYPQTPDQLNALQEVKKDMESPLVMDRLLCGDVGYGKTEVAMRAAFKAVMDNKQVALLVPTTILAQQHYHNFRQRLKDFPVNVRMLSRFKSPLQQKEIIAQLKDGGADIVIGTHRLLSDDIVFKDLGLLIIDEEQRFGVAAKEKLKSLRLNVDILTLTATPIPRTLYMGLMGLKDISAINTPPQNRIPVETFVVEYDEDIIAQALRREFNRQGQAFFVHNQIYDIIEVCDKVKSLAPAAAVVRYAHGQMDGRELEEIMIKFLNKEIDCLVSTTIVESGIDLPMANTLIVNNAHTFGLSDLHQLRGRVGRLNRRAYAYFLIPSGQALNPRSRTRLEAIKEYAQLGSGFKIAMEDLEIRGAGNLLGYQQHGYIQAVGFDLYCRLLKEAVSTLVTS